jgi:protein SCO1/2
MRIKWLIPAAVAVGVLFGVVFTVVQRSPHEFAGTVFSESQAAPDFTLTSDNGDAVSLDSFRGKVILLYFGYTFCPDVCPATLAELSAVLDELEPSQQDRVQVAMVTVDPARDTPDVLDGYLAHFDPSFIGFTGTDAQIAAVADDYHVYYEAQAGTADTGYLVDHWSGVYLVDPEGNLVESFGFGTAPDLIAGDVVQWL